MMPRPIHFSLLLAASLLPPSIQAQHMHHGSEAADTTASKQAAANKAVASAWTQHPLLVPAKPARGERGGARLIPQGMNTEQLTVHAPEGPADRLRVDYPVTAEGARIESATPQIGNYHWIVAREENSSQVRVASTAWYFGNPGDSPKRLLQTIKHELEIVPDPLPREHAGYRESEKWRFLVRFNGQPVAAQRLTLETEFGSRTAFVTDAAGFATVLFPRDFGTAATSETASGHGRQRAMFVLATEKTEGDRQYVTAFNHFYGNDADRGKSLGWGAAFGLIGMLAATPLLRRRKEPSKTAGDTNHA